MNFFECSVLSILTLVHLVFTLSSYGNEHHTFILASSLTYHTSLLQHAIIVQYQPESTSNRAHDPINTDAIPDFSAPISSYPVDLLIISCQVPSRAPFNSLYETTITDCSSLAVKAILSSMPASSLFRQDRMWPISTTGFA